MPNQKEYPRRQEGSNIAKIVIDRDLCIGAQSCIAPGKGTFAINGENKAIVVDANIASDEDLMLAAQSCPTKAILLFDQAGQQLN